MCQQEKSLMLPIGIVATVVVAALALYAFLPGPSPDDGLPQETVLYYGETCPHCLIVEKYIADNAIRDKMAFAVKEVYRDQDNAREMRAVVRKCGVGSGVPLLWDGAACYVGDRNIIEFFAEHAGTPIPAEL